MCSLKRQWSGTHAIEFHILSGKRAQPLWREVQNSTNGKPKGQLFPSKWTPGYHKQCEQKVKDKQTVGDITNNK